MNFFENTRKPQGFGGKLMINGELVIEWKKEKSIKYVVVENICYD